MRLRCKDQKYWFPEANRKIRYTKFLGNSATEGPNGNTRQKKTPDKSLMTVTGSQDTSPPSFHPTIAA